MSSLTASAAAPRRPLFLTGMMGAGKSTLAAFLARQWSCPLVDLDARIERMFGAAIPALFAAGEPQFRRCEREALWLLVGEPGFHDRTVVVATGGGVVIDPANRRAMRDAGLVVFLDVPVAELARRLTGQSPGSRPLLGTQPEAVAARLQELLAQRRSAYEDADVVVDGSGPPQDVAGRLVAALSARTT
jgi:shikimate kinase